MSNFRATPTITRSWTAYLVASVSAAVALNMAFLPLGMAAGNATVVRPALAEVATPLRAAAIDHSVIAADAVSVGDAHTVEMSIAAYERAPELSLPQ